MKTTQRPQHGDVAWFVQWWPTTVIDENGDFDHDATEAASKQKRCLSRIDAMAFAKDVWSPDNAFGVVEMHQARYITQHDDGESWD